MTGTLHSIGAHLTLPRAALQELIDALRAAGYRTVGPQVRDGAIVYDDLATLAQLPLGWIDEQDGGRYRLVRDEQAGWFAHVVGPHSLKSYVFPPREVVLTAERRDGAWTMQAPSVEIEPVAVIGVRGCDLAALAVQDRVFLGGPYVDPAYQARRSALFLVAVHCSRAAATCFCHSMGTGPAAKGAFDLALTEHAEQLLIEIGSPAGAEIMSRIDARVATPDEIAAARAVPRQLAANMAARASAPRDTGNGSEPRQRSLDTTNLRDRLLTNLEHPRWEEIADRCLACANCTLVCPTCFCSKVEEVSDLSGDRVDRERAWASCFTADHSYMNSGTVRKSIAARYRQWLTHKLASWIDQFGVSGCVGCGRCITWCPVGIDLTEEVAAMSKGGDA